MQQNYPQKPGIDFILRQAFFYWSRTLWYQLLFSLIFFTIFLSVFFYFSEKYAVLEQLLNAAAEYQKTGASGYDKYRADIAKVFSTEGFQVFYFVMVGVSVFLFPLNLGLLQIFRKMDLKEKITVNDLFAGYVGINFFRYISYFIFWFFTYVLIAQTIILPVVWVFCTVLVSPIMFFNNKTFVDAVVLNFKALKIYFLEIFVCVLVAFIFKYIGLLLFIVGGLITFPFWNAVIYSLYKVIYENNEIK